jgi:hypothetical protein
VAAEIVHDDDIAGPEGGRELGLHTCIEDRPVHWRVDNPRSNETVALEARHKSLCSPVAKAALPFSRSPFTDRPRRWVIFVVVPVSSMKTAVRACSRMMGCGLLSSPPAPCPVQACLVCWPEVFFEAEPAGDHELRKGGTVTNLVREAGSIIGP